MAIVKSSSSSPAAALLLATLLLFAAASAAVAQQAPPPPEEDDETEPGCPDDIDDIIVMAVKGKKLSDETLAEFDELTTGEVYDCVCDNIVNATGITSASPGAISHLVKDVVKSLGRNSDLSSVGDCNPTLPNTQKPETTQVIRLLGKEKQFLRWWKR